MALSAHVQGHLTNHAQNQSADVWALHKLFGLLGPQQSEQLWQQLSSTAGRVVAAAAGHVRTAAQELKLPEECAFELLGESSTAAVLSVLRRPLSEPVCAVLQNLEARRRGAAPKIYCHKCCFVMGPYRSVSQCLRCQQNVMVPYTALHDALMQQSRLLANLPPLLLHHHHLPFIAASGGVHTPCCCCGCCCCVEVSFCMVSPAALQASSSAAPASTQVEDGFACGYFPPVPGFVFL